MVALGVIATATWWRWREIRQEGVGGCVGENSCCQANVLTPRRKGMVVPCGWCCPHWHPVLLGASVECSVLPGSLWVLYSGCCVQMVGHGCPGMGAVSGLLVTMVGSWGKTNHELQHLGIRHSYLCLHPAAKGADKLLGLLLSESIDERAAS